MCVCVLKEVSRDLRIHSCSVYVLDKIEPELVSEETSMFNLCVSKRDDSRLSVVDAFIKASIPEELQHRLRATCSETLKHVEEIVCESLSSKHNICNESHTYMWGQIGNFYHPEHISIVKYLKQKHLHIQDTTKNHFERSLKDLTLNFFNEKQVEQVLSSPVTEVVFLREKNDPSHMYPLNISKVSNDQRMRYEEFVSTIRATLALGLSTFYSLCATSAEWFPISMIADSEEYDLYPLPYSHFTIQEPQRVTDVDSALPDCLPSTFPCSLNIPHSLNQSLASLVTQSSAQSITNQFVTEQGMTNRYIEQALVMIANRDE